MSIALGVGGLPAGADNNGGNGGGSNANAQSANPGNSQGNPGAHGNSDNGPSGNGSNGNPGNANPGSGNGNLANGNPGQSNGNPHAGAGSGSTGGGSAETSTQGSVSDVRSEPAAAVSGTPSSGGGGANGGCGEYCEIPPSPSLNGNGGGNATGRPAAGSVGKADNKNPRGQFKDGLDPNNGYECDGNNGIAKGNPAHTRGCTTAGNPPPVVPPVNPPPVVTPGRPPVVPPVTPPGQLAPAVPLALVGQPTSRPTVLGVLLERPTLTAAAPPTAAPGAQVRGVTIERGAPGALASTGANALDMGALGLGLILGGAALARANRRRPEEG